MVSRHIPFPTNDSNVSFLLAEWYSTVYPHHIAYPSSFGRYADHCQDLAIIIYAAICLLWLGLNDNMKISDCLKSLWDVSSDASPFILGRRLACPAPLALHTNRRPMPPATLELLELQRTLLLCTEIAYSSATLLKIC